jgi:hypothetical protein
MSYRKTTAVLEAKGSFKKNPQLKRVDPKTTDEIGEPPAYFSETEAAVWHELIATSPKGVLKNSDRTALEIASTLLTDYRKDRESFNTARLNTLQKALASLGRTPVDRGRIAAPEPEMDEDNPWAQLIRDYG